MAMEKPIIALMTDYGYRDTYVSELKAVILRHRRDVQLVDITHEVESFNEFEAAFLLKEAAKSFPENTIFICVIDPKVGTERRGIIFITKRGNIFIGPDTGIMYPAASAEEIIESWWIDSSKLPARFSETFHGRDVFAEIAGRIVKGEDMESFARRTFEYAKIEIPKPEYDGNEVRAVVLRVDKFGNIITNIHHSEISMKHGRAKILIRGRGITAPFVPSYGHVERGKPALVIGGTGYLELAVNMGSAARKYRVKAGDKIRLILPR